MESPPGNDIRKLSTELFSVLAGEGKTVIDIGAAPGSFSFPAAPGGSRVLSFQPESVVPDIPGTLPQPEKADLVRIWAEGREMAVLEGIWKILDGNEDIRILIYPDIPGREGKEIRSAGLFQWLEAKGFDVFRVDDEAGKIRKAGPAAVAPAAGQKEAEGSVLLCIKKTRSLFVAFLSHSGELAGAERSLTELVAGLTKRGILCSVILPGSGPLEQELRKLPVSVEKITYEWWTYNESVSREQRTGEILGSVPGLLLLLKRMDPDIIYTNTSVINAGAIAARILGKPHVWHIREFGRSEHFIRCILGEAERFAYINSASDKVIFNSRALEKTFGHYLDPGKAEVIYNNIRIKLTGDGPGSAGPFKKEDSLKIAVVGSIYEAKGQLTAVEAAKLLLDRDVNLEMSLAGYIVSEDYYRRIRDYIDENGIGERVSLTGFISNPHDLMNLADAVVDCQENEAFGRVIIEAMCLGKPVIAADCGESRDIITGSNAGFLFEIGNSPDLAEKIGRLSGNKSLAGELGENGKKFAGENFSDAKYSGRICELLKSVKDKRTESLPGNSILGSGEEVIRQLIVRNLEGNGNGQPIRLEENAFREKDNIILRKENTIREKERIIREMENRIREKDSRILEKEKVIRDLLNSSTWRWSGPVRKVADFLGIPGKKKQVRSTKKYPTA